MTAKKTGFILCHALSGLLTAFFLTWLVLAQCNFFYGFWHDQVGIAEGIEEYGPQNRYRTGFADTSRTTRVRLFGEINQAIHNGGRGLASIAYQSPTVDQPQTLLRAPEIGHLKDVANLIDTLKWVSGLVLLLWALSCLGIVLHRFSLPKLRYQLAAIGGVFLLAGVVVFAVGPVELFNLLHIWIFPADNPWFFYYQDSLMSTMMLAPRLFGWIIVAWVPMAIACFLVQHLIVTQIERAVSGKQWRGP